MGWFDEQIEYRQKRERELLSDSFENIARSVTGRSISSGFREGADVSDAVSQLLGYFHIKEKEVPEKLRTLQDQLDFLLSSTGIQYREVDLKEGWSGDSMCALITSMKEDGSVVTLLPGTLGSYRYIDPHSGETVRVTRAEESKLDGHALCFYRPLPQRKLSIKDLFRYMAECLTVWDILSFVLAALAVTLVGLVIPKLNHILIGEVIDNASYRLLYAVASFMFFATIGGLMFGAIRDLLLQRISNKMNTSVQAAAMMRVLSLPASFFKDYTAGELNQYLNYLNSLCMTITNSVISTGITGVFSLIYIGQIFSFAPALVIPSLIVTLLTLGISLLSSFLQMKINRDTMRFSAKERGLVYNLIGGIQKIRLSGAEDRAFVRWADQYAKTTRLTYSSPLFLRISTVISSAISLCGTAIIYYISVKSGISAADYYAFNAAYAYISAAFGALTGVVMTAANIKPGLEIIRPLMEAEPEITEGLETVASLSGSIELSHISFRYEKDAPYVIDDLSMTIPARQYVAIVGRSGCGKSTLMRLLLGFEEPTRGAIYYDKRDTKRLDMGSVRRQIGTVMQDGKLFGGSIYENITISAPELNLDAAWEAAEIAGMADDIRQMPMGMHTMLQEGTGGISGGQRQRLMIARAVAPKPKILMFDEATSALDNVTQKKVSEALDRMKCTRIVIAHRLSTIKNCDRILVLDHGKIIEDGTYEQLIEKNGFFADLVERQRLDNK